MHDNILDTDTIAAVATPQGSGGISVIKLSGPRALSLVSSVFRSSRDPGSHEREMVYGKIISVGETIDEALVCYMRAPRSYTGEDVVEIQTHGGRAASAAVLELLVQGGARPAGPGEFTRRAFLNGKMDLVQAEAVQQIASAESMTSLRYAERMLEGSLSRTVREMLVTLNDSIARLELHLDFSDQTDDQLRAEEIVQTLTTLLKRMDMLLATCRSGRLLRKGFRTVITGKVNVGKSSLFNALLGKTRAIVNQRPGTTRDWIEEKLEMEGLLFDLVDTAGLRETGDDIEQAGMRESERLVADADITVRILEPHEFPAHPGTDTVVQIYGKADCIGSEERQHGALYISPVSGEGLDTLRKILLQTARNLIAHDTPGDFYLLDRHRFHLEQAKNAVQRALSVLDSWSEEVIVFELREASRELESILGRQTSPDILDTIFRNFCIGK